MPQRKIPLIDGVSPLCLAFTARRPAPFPRRDSQAVKAIPAKARARQFLVDQLSARNPVAMLSALVPLRCKRA